VKEQTEQLRAKHGKTWADLQAIHGQHVHLWSYEHSQACAAGCLWMHLTPKVQLPIMSFLQICPDLAMPVDRWV